VLRLKLRKNRRIIVLKLALTTDRIFILNRPPRGCSPF
jgi:hypothetical protein